MLHGVPDHLELPPALAQGQALGHHVQRDLLGLQRPLAVLFGTLVQGVALGQSRGLFENVSDNSSYNFLLLWPHTSCSMADRPGELKQNFHANLATELVPHPVANRLPLTPSYQLEVNGPINQRVTIT